jgi:hypothetical protein
MRQSDLVPSRAASLRAACHSVALAAAVAGCNSFPTDALQTKPLQYLAGESCDPMVAGQCGMPFPSNVYLVNDAKAGRQVVFGPGSLPVVQGNYTNPSAWETSDGFSPGLAPMTYLPGAVSTGSWSACAQTGSPPVYCFPTPCDVNDVRPQCQGKQALEGYGLASGCSASGGTCPALPTIQDSLNADSPTVIIEADTGTRVPHWAELDHSVNDDSPLGSRTLSLRPAVRLKDATRYIVAIRNIIDDTGKVLPPSPVFEALRDGKSSSDPTVAPRQALYSDIFSRLSKAGVAKDNLQIAWDFTTASKANNTGTLIKMRDAALTAVGSAGPTYDTTAQKIPVGDEVHGIITYDSAGNPTPNPFNDLGTNPYLAMMIEGTFHVPLYLTTPEPPQTPSGPPCRIVRDAAGNPVQNGWADYPFLVQIPKTVVASGTPAPILLNGHGLLGSRTEGVGSTGYLSRFASDKQYIAVSIDLTGFDHNAVQVATNAVQSDIGGFVNMVDPQHQGIVNQVLVIRMLLGAFAQDSRFFFNAQGQPDPNGHSVIDTAHAFYRGDSQGGIMGTTLIAIEPDIQRAFLGEPGFPYSLLLNRSLDFAGYFALMQATYTKLGGRDIQVVLGLMQMLWDRTEPDGYVPYITQANWADHTPAHQVMIEDALGDFQVSPLGAHLIARAVGARNVKPVNRELFGIPDADGPFTGSGLIELNFHLDQNPSVQLPFINIANNGPDNCDPHGSGRETSPVFDLSDQFFRQGIIQNFCTGATLEASPTDPIWACDFSYQTGPTPEQLLETSKADPPVACNPG